MGKTVETQIKTTKTKIKLNRARYDESGLNSTLETENNVNNSQSWLQCKNSEDIGCTGAK